MTTKRSIPRCRGTDAAIFQTRSRVTEDAEKLGEATNHGK